MKNSEFKVGDIVKIWDTFDVITSISKPFLHQSVKKMCVSWEFKFFPIGMTAFLDDYSEKGTEGVKLYERK